GVKKKHITAFDVKENENDVHVSANGSDKSDNKKHDKNTKRDDKGKYLVDSLTRVRDLRAEFEEFSFNSSNKVTAVSASVNATGPNPTNSTNSFNTASTFVNDVSLNFGITGKSLFMDPSKYPDDPDMPQLEDIVYSDDEEDVGAEAHLSNLETNIHMDVKRTFLYETIEEEVYVCQPPRFKDPNYPDKVYVDDIIFRSTNKEQCKAFEKLMKDKFQMSSMGELTFFLGLQVKQKNDEIFFSQDKYVAEILRKFGFTDVKSASTPIETEKRLLKDPDVNAARHFITAVSYELMLFSLLKVAAVNLMLLGHKLVLSRLCALIDGKKVIVSEAIIRRYLHLDDVDECLSTKRTAWNEFSYSMTSAVICLATGRKFNFSKYIFENMVRNADSPSKFLMYPRFLKVVMDNQVDYMTTQTTRYTSPALIQKVFVNMRRVGKGFSGVKTPLFASMLVQPQPQAEEDIKIPIAPAPPSTTKSDEEVVPMDAESHGRLNQEDVNAASKGVSVVGTPELVSATEPIIFYDEDVTMTMAQTLIKLKVEKAKLLDDR
nr:hypothetical protein [Tanacetum cinerariifolium]